MLMMIISWTRLLLPVSRTIGLFLIGIAQLSAQTVSSDHALRSAKDKGPPRLVPIQPITERLLMEGDTLRLACPVVATPRAIVTWEKDAVTVRPLAWERHHLTQDGLLIVYDLEVDDSGSYVCRATNGFGTVEFRFQVKILAYPTGVPEFTDPFMANLTVSDGSSAVFRCHIRSSSHPNIQWLKRVDVTEEDRHPSNSTIFVDGWLFVVLQRGPVHAQDLASGSYVSKFTILSATIEDSGMYICVATNTEGFSTFNAFLHIISRKRNDSSNVGLSLEYSSGLWALPLLTSVVLVLVFSLTLTVAFVCLRHRRNQSTKGLVPGGPNHHHHHHHHEDSSLVYPVPGIVLSAGYSEELTHLAEHPPGCGPGFVERCGLENCSHLVRKNWTHDRRSTQKSSNNSFYLLASTGGFRHHDSG